MYKVEIPFNLLRIESKFTEEPDAGLKLILNVVYIDQVKYWLLEHFNQIPIVYIIRSDVEQPIYYFKVNTLEQKILFELAWL